ncbi:MAG TPA: hypothetical protein VN692_01560 [Steroidobacteraceae bacterium]|nr:hypothetical protein [Steroidobacteraceae bacterium]
MGAIADRAGAAAAIAPPPSDPARGILKLLSIVELLAHYRRVGRFQRNIDLHDAAIVIFGVFYHHYLRIALHRRVRIAEVESDLARQIPLLFKTWTSQLPRVRKNDT